VMWSKGYRFQVSGFISRPFERDRARACRQHEASCTIVIPAEAGMKSSGRGTVGNGGLSRAD
jgi:hypothetical protein